MPTGVAAEYLNNGPRASSCEGLLSDVRERRVFFFFFLARFFFMCWFIVSCFLLPFPVPLSLPSSASRYELIFDLLVRFKFLLATVISLTL